jgi:LPS sulfotransferase NodH
MRYTEPQVSSELLDQPTFVGAPRKLFICSTPRSGSYLLCRYMINAGLGVPHEYFNPIIMRQMAPRLGLGPDIERVTWRPRGRVDRLLFGNSTHAAEENFLNKYLAALIPRRCQGGVFAAKIHFDQFLKVLNNPTGRQLLEGGVFVHLYREDLVKQAVSTYFANLTGRWGIDETITTAPVEHPDFFDVAALDRAVQALADDDKGWRIFLARNGLSPLSIAYEEMCKDPFKFVLEIARRLDLDPAVLRRGYSETNDNAADRAAGLPSKSDVARHYIARLRTVPRSSPESAEGEATENGVRVRKASG